MRFSSIIVTLVVILNALFTVAVLFVFLKVGNEPSILIGAWFSFTTGELFALSSIRKAKIKHLKKEDSSIGGLDNTSV